MHTNIIFTIETESSNKLSFLDMFFDKTQSPIDFSVYRKLTYIPR